VRIAHCQRKTREEMPLSVEVVENFTRMELGKDMKPSLLKTWLENTLKKCRHNHTIRILSSQPASSEVAERSVEIRNDIDRGETSWNTKC
jgi:hypothetical protein